MLSVRNLEVYHGDVRSLKDVSFDISPGEVLCLLGRNGAGKTTSLRAIMGLAPVRSGSVVFDGVELTSLPPHAIPKTGIGYVPQGRRLFAEMTVRENLEIGLMARNTDRAILDSIFSLFPVLKSRLQQVSGTLSGGEQQMLAMARALCLDPALILMDEPTEGLMPSMIATIRDVILELRARGKAVLLVEQRMEAVLSVADRVCFVENGETKATMATDVLRVDPDLVKAYVGIV
ncbi:urea ABC transporter ATP-binding subunit UrtE [Rhizobium sp. Leaf311]|uniref:ABC transporter ATP-binding protein n=1 Tax=Rhizobium sp. Leaf311 TaxID=1736332 RepID=UPI000715D988|nr:ABC transporter ATP-binding protein [Rhizobium sp. Leaf311]KQQ55253.1 urea ABC transporter ATP-binding subunit UrtE [Rhizobium sp. Leaf311]